MSEQTFQQDAERDVLKQEDTFEALSNAYAFVHGQEDLRSVASMTFGQLLRTRIDEIRGPHPQDLPSRLEEIEKVNEEFKAAIVKIRAEEEEAG